MEHRLPAGGGSCRRFPGGERPVAVFVAAFFALSVAWASPAGAAAIVAGGGPRATDCLAVFKTEAPPNAGAAALRCRDGDSSCDADGEVDGRCTFPVAVCVNSTNDPVCTSPGVADVKVAHAVDNGDPAFDPAFQALQSRIDALDTPTADPDHCSIATRVVVPVIGPLPGNRCRGSRRVLRLSTRSIPAAGQPERFDQDALRLACLPAGSTCDPRTLFSGTHDRIQKQVFDQRCALSGCHDSQARAAGLLLEVGASRGNLVGIEPTNAAAAAAGWKRVDAPAPGVGNSATSLLLAKVTGDLPAGFGSRMPYQRRPLAAQEIELLRLWVEAGAPAEGWVPGTDE